MIRRRVLLLATLLAAGHLFAEVGSLSHLFAPGRGLLDRDGDGLPDAIGFSVVIPDNPTAYELALAADLSARANLESLVADYRLVRRESEVNGWESLASPVLVGSGLGWLRDAARDQGLDLAALAPDEAVVFAFSWRGRRGLGVAGGSGEALLRAGRAFFLRWPYFWEVWGRDTGATFLSLEADLARFFAERDITLATTVIREARYRFPGVPEPPGALRALDLRGGEIERLAVDVHFLDEGDQRKAAEALAALRDQRTRGERSDVLSYMSVARTDLALVYGRTRIAVDLPRTGSSKRLLTPAFREPPRPEAAERDFDLRQALSVKGLYSDADGDGIPDGVETTVVIPPSLNGKALAAFAAKLVLPVAGGSFPLVAIDREVESRAALTAPVLVGPNALARDLERTGRFKPPALESGWGLVRVVPRAFNKTAALVVAGADSAGLERTLDWFARAFPRFGDAREGAPDLAAAARDLEAFLSGERGGAEAWFSVRLQKVLEEAAEGGRSGAALRLVLPSPNPGFAEFARRSLAAGSRDGSARADAGLLTDAKPAFEAARDLPWEGDELLALVRESVAAAGGGPLRVRAGVSESAEVRRTLRREIEKIVEAAGSPPAEVEVLSAYKPGLSWLTERVAPLLKGKGVHRLTVRFARAADDDPKPKRLRPDPNRWLQELYPADDLLARELGLPVERIGFQMKEEPDPVYEASAFDERNGLVFQQGFSPRTRELPVVAALPEWGATTVTTGWLRAEAGPKVLVDRAIETDLERFWSFYQDEVLTPLHAYVLKKTGGAPTFSKQPYFRRLLVDLRLSEPDGPLGLDQEILSSLESMHDEIYFDTLDVLRGITSADPDEAGLPPDTSRSSAPGNVLPLVRPSLEGAGGRVRATLEEAAAEAPEMEVRWTGGDGRERTRREAFPKLKPKSVRVPGLVYDGREERVERVSLEAEFEREDAYNAAIDLLAAYRDLAERGLLKDAFRYPGVRALEVTVRYKDLEKTEVVPVLPPAEPERAEPAPAAPGEPLVPTDRILDPAEAGEIARRLGRLPGVRAYVGGSSYEKRDIPVLELYWPPSGEVSIARLTSFKPTLQLSCRQHANEVSSTSYGLRFAETLARDRAGQEVLKRVNVVLQPVENPDGAALACGLQKEEPFHCLHAGRYGALGMDIGAQTPSNRALLPEAEVRNGLLERWRPDIHLNLHGYPSHEWVQVFRGYAPFLFRDYWIPKGWFAYVKAPSLPVYEPYAQAGLDLQELLAAEMGADEKARETDRRLHDRFQRWAGRWQPHLSFLELRDGVNLYAKRRGGAETRLTPRTRTTFVEETPEVMDETATGPWLQAVCEQGLAYLRAHAKYLVQARPETARIEEEVRDRVRISFVRARPGRLPRKAAAGRPEGVATGTGSW